MKLLLVLLGLLFPSAALADRFEQALAHVAEGQYSQAAAGFHELADDGDLTAAHNLAVLFALGEGVPQSYAEATYWAWRAFLDGLTQAGPLADLVLAELSEPERAALAERLEARFAPRAQDGQTQAMLALAVVLALLRVEPDLLAAHDWQSIAAALDHPSAGRAREETRKLMPPALRSEASAHAVQAFRDWCAMREGAAPSSCRVVRP